MNKQFVINEKGQRIAVILPIAEYENLLHKNHINLELTVEYKMMIDEMIKQENNNAVRHASYDQIKDRFRRK